VRRSAETIAVPATVSVESEVTEATGYPGRRHRAMMRKPGDLPRPDAHLRPALTILFGWVLLACEDFMQQRYLTHLFDDGPHALRGKVIGIF